MKLLLFIFAILITQSLSKVYSPAVQEKEAVLDSSSLPFILENLIDRTPYSSKSLEVVGGETLESTTEVLNVRDKACTDGRVVATIGKEDRVRFLGGILTACGHRWLKIQGHNFNEGWASDSFLKITATPSAGTNLYPVTSLTIRAGACHTAESRGVVQQGTALQSVGRSQVACGHHWWAVRGPGITGEGWAASYYLSLTQRGGPDCRVRNYPLFKQCDGRWANDRLGSSSTICRVGCLMCSVAMAMNALGKRINGQAVDCRVLNTFLRGHGGYQGNLYVWGAIARYGFHYEGQPSDKNFIAREVCAGKVAILQIDRGAHWVLAIGVRGQNFLINDPGRIRHSVPFNQVLRAGMYRV